MTRKRVTVTAVSDDCWQRLMGATGTIYEGCKTLDPYFRADALTCGRFYFRLGHEVKAVA